MPRSVAAGASCCCTWRVDRGSRDLARAGRLGTHPERGLAVNVRRVAAVAFAGFLMLLGHQPGWVPSATAQTTDSERAFVYGINAAVPDNFVGTFAPPTADAIFLLADGTSVISPRYTEIYFWPITNEYRADWSALNEPVPGVLEVVKDGRVVAELTSTDYTIHFKQEGTTTTGELFLGQAAVDAEADFRARQEAFQKASSEYQRAEQAWLDAMAEVNNRQQAGETRRDASGAGASRTDRHLQQRSQQRLPDRSRSRPVRHSAARFGWHDRARERAHDERFRSPSYRSWLHRRPRDAVDDTARIPCPQRRHFRRGG